MSELPRGLHDLVLGKAAMGIRIHAVTSARVEVLDVAQAEGAAAILVALELGDRRLGGICAVETDNTAALGPADRLILDLGLLDLADSGEEFNQIVVAGRPRELRNQKSQPMAELGRRGR